MIASEFIYDDIVSGLTLNFPIFIGPSAAPQGSYTTIMEIGSNSNPAYLRDTYFVDFIGRYEKTDYQDGMREMYALRDGILGHPNITDADGNIWCRFLLGQGPQFSHVDETGRAVITMIIEVTVDSDTGTYRESIA